ncbi:MAG: aminotransferase class III-fold pyridoxal phosphate-dependent enzyme, partial [Steroidobacteraceae bacterium]
VLDVIEEQRLLARAEEIGRLIRKRLESRTTTHDGAVAIGSPRGLGAMIGFDVLNRSGGEPDGLRAKLVTQRALAEGLILLSCGSQGATLRILLPLTISDATLAEGLDKLERALGP